MYKNNSQTNFLFKFRRKKSLFTLIIEEIRLFFINVINIFHFYTCTISIIIYYTFPYLVGFPSGQRGQTVNLLATPSMVRIHPPPPFFLLSYSTCISCNINIFILKLILMDPLFRHLYNKITILHRRLFSILNNL